MSSERKTSERPNLLFVCVDCLRQDFLRTDRTQTPFLDELRADGLECTALYATATTTTPCVASLLTGTYNERNGLLSLRHGHLSQEVRPLAQRFGSAGYHTEAMVTGPLLPETGLDRGFDVYDHRAESASLFGDWRADALDRLESLPEPFAAVVHLWELHEDIHVPRAYDDPEYGVTPYGRALSALDAELRALVEAVPEETVVALVGDHGESITHRHNPLRLLAKSLRDAVRYYGGVDTRSLVNRLNRALDGLGPDIDDRFIENGHGENVLDITTNVPFVLSGPGIEPATVSEQVRQIDVLPTLLRAFDRPVAGVDGEPIDPETVSARPAYMRACGASLHRERNWARAIRSDDAKYVAFPRRDWDPEVYDLAADPRELTPIDDADLAARLAPHLPPVGEPPTETEQLDIDDHLRDLGYL